MKTKEGAHNKKIVKENFSDIKELIKLHGAVETAKITGLSKSTIYRVLHSTSLKRFHEGIKIEIQRRSKTKRAKKIPVKILKTSSLKVGPGHYVVLNENCKIPDSVEFNSTEDFQGKRQSLLERLRDFWKY